MDKLAAVLQIFFEKYLIPSTMAVAGAILTLLLVPENYWMVERLGDTFFLILTFCICFIGFLLLIWIAQFIKASISTIRSNMYYADGVRKSDKEVIERINKFVDDLSQADKDILFHFVKNGNKTLIAGNSLHFCNSLLEDTNVMNRTDFRGDISDIDENKYWLEPFMKEGFAKGFQPASDLSQYKLKDQFYDILKQVYELNGRLGNF